MCVFDVLHARERNLNNRAHTYTNTYTYRRINQNNQSLQTQPSSFENIPSLLPKHSPLSLYLDIKVHVVYDRRVQVLNPKP
jgi:hypothetical protein